MAAVLLCLLANPIVMLLFGTAGESVCGRATEYLIGMAISFLPFSFYSASFSALRGVGDSKSCLRLTIIINVIHLVLSMIFLNVMHLDIFGTILSYFLARIVGGATALYSLMNKHGQIGVRFSDIFRFEPKLLKSIFRMGIPFAIEQCFYNGGTVIVQTYMVQLGNIAVAANAIANSVFSLIYAAGFAVSVVTLTVTGQCIGAGEIALAKHYGRRMEWLGNAICTLSVIVILPLMPFLLMLYAPEAQTLPVIYPLCGSVPLLCRLYGPEPTSCRIRCALRAMRILLPLPRLYACGWRASALDICSHCRLVSASTVCGLPWA